MNILEIRNLRKSFKDMRAVDGITLSVDRGEVHGILGPNGAGKSTTINCILGLMPFDSGSVVFEGGTGIRKWSRNIGYVPQDLAIYPDLTPAENIHFFCSLYGFSGADLATRVDQALDFVGLADVRDKKSKEFSGGMKRRLNLACGIAHSPKLVVMDEPTVGIDPQSRNRILENVRTLNEAGTTVLYTTHYMPEVEEICSKVTIIDHGKVIATGTKVDIMGRMGKDTELVIDFIEGTGDLASFIQTTSGFPSVLRSWTEGVSAHMRHAEDAALMGAVIEAAAQCGLSIKSIDNREPSLEEIFLALTGTALRDEQ